MFWARCSITLARASGKKQLRFVSGCSGRAAQLPWPAPLGNTKLRFVSGRFGRAAQLPWAAPLGKNSFSRFGRAVQLPWTAPPGKNGLDLLAVVVGALLNYLGPRLREKTASIC